MKIKKSYLLLFTIATVSINVGTLTSQNRQTSVGWNIQEVSMVKWDPQDGLPYKEVPGANLGVTSFEVLKKHEITEIVDEYDYYDLVDQNKIAFLSNASNEIIITDKSNGKIIKRLPVSLAPRDFVYDEGFFFVLNENMVNIYDENGSSVNKISIPVSYLGTERLTRFNGSTYLLLPSGNCLKIETGGNSVDPKEYEGWITSAGHFVATKLRGDNSYSVKVIAADGKSYEKTLTTNKNVAGVYVVGATENRIILDVQKFNSENPISVERNIVSVELNATGLAGIVASFKVPDCYYVLSNKDFQVSADGSILNMVTAPEGVFIFSISETKENAKDYPASLSTIKYHFNDHLIQDEEK